MRNKLNKNDTFSLISLFFRCNGLVNQQKDSYNRFISYEIQRIVNRSPILSIKNIVDSKKYSISKKSIHYRIKYSQIYFSKPILHESSGDNVILSPYISRIRNLTLNIINRYSSDIFIDLIKVFFEKELNSFKYTNKKRKLLEKVWIGKIPSMLGSKVCNTENYNYESKIIKNECPYDDGGYFIINGNEKVLVAQERMIKNHVYVFKRKSNNVLKFSAQCRYSTKFRSQNLKYSNKGYIIYVKVNKKIINQYNYRWSGIQIKMTSLKNEIPLVVVLKSLGLNNDKDILLLIFKTFNESKYNELFYTSLLESLNIVNQKMALRYIGKRTFGISLTSNKTEYENIANDLLDSKLLPHMGVTKKDRIKKAFFLCYMAKRMIDVALDNNNEDDKDSYKNKRVDLSGFLLSSLFNNLFNKFIKETKRNLVKWITSKKFISINLILKQTIITNGFHFALATGNWINDGTLDYKTGVSQLLNRMSFLSMLSHLGRLNSSFMCSGKVLDVRKVHKSYWGIICPCETPEGQTCGIVKNFAFLTYISSASSIDEKLKNFILSIIKTEKIHTEQKLIPHASFILNGSIIGLTDHPSKIFRFLLYLRRLSFIRFDISIYFIEQINSIFMWTDSGRLKRPCMILKNSNLLINKTALNYSLLFENIRISWRYLLQNSFIEYLDILEIENSILYKKLKPRKFLYLKNGKLILRLRNHVELNISCILGISASQIPFIQHNQSPRNTYQSSMGKQSIGINALNKTSRFETRANYLEYFQRPLIFTKQKRLLRGFELPTGLNTIVAIMSYTGHNQEDSIIASSYSFERGLFRTIISKSFTAKESSISLESKETIGLKENEMIPNINMDFDGTCKIGSFVKGADIIVSKTLEMENSCSINAIGSNTPLIQIDSSIRLPPNNQGVVDSVLITTNEEGYKLVKTKVLENLQIRSLRDPVIGDKFSSQHGQKGIIGMTFTENYMPVSENSIVPDMVLNPHAIPSRMTIGHLIETVAAKASALSGNSIDATPFMIRNNPKINEHLEKLNYTSDGLEIMINGFTTIQIPLKIFIGPVYYQRLRHMVIDKYFSRSTGPYETLTRQPVEGRNREGGLRFGEMERDCVLGHGAAFLLKDRLLDNSDVYRLHICEKSGFICPANLKSQTFWSTIWTKTSVCQIFIPYACKLLFQELFSMCISPRISTSAIK
uniref:DNA-directed RNA polymerase subunit beta n=1 Tax=Amorphochlora amoebiformis TaxID=1561963 RepID=A0A0H5BIG9_9EUKA|nr:DNA-directed RNA polymerase II second largest subunit [Amorphochlora amoebiformis]